MRPDRAQRLDPAGSAAIPPPAGAVPAPPPPSSGMSRAHAFTWTDVDTAYQRGLAEGRRQATEDVRALAAGWLKDGPDGAARVLAERVLGLVGPWETAEQSEPSAHPEATCHRCHGLNIAWSAPSPLWNAVMRGGAIGGEDEFDGIVCPTCFAVLAEQRGIAVLWRLSAERIHVELETTSPDGRVWDSERWLWVEPATGGVVDAAPACRIEIFESRSAGWVWRCHTCDVTHTNRTEEQARREAAEHDEALTLRGGKPEDGGR
jgi:hypothetical protein